MSKNSTRGFFQEKNDEALVRTAMDYLDEMKRLRAAGVPAIRLHDYDELYEKQRLFVMSPSDKFYLLVGLHGCGKSYMYQTNKYKNVFYSKCGTALKLHGELYTAKDKSVPNYETSPNDRHFIADECHHLLKCDKGMKATKDATEQTLERQMILDSRTSIAQVDDNGEKVVQHVSESGKETYAMVPQRYKTRSRIMLISNFIPEEVFQREGASFFSRFDIYYFIPTHWQIHAQVANFPPSVFDVKKHKDVYDFVADRISDYTIRLLDMRLYAKIAKWKEDGEDWRSNFFRGYDNRLPAEKAFVEIVKSVNPYADKTKANYISNSDFWLQTWKEKTKGMGDNGKSFDASYFWKIKKAFDELNGGKK